MRTPQLAAWPISGKNAEITSFRRKLARSSLARGGKKQINPTTPSLGDGIAGVVDGVPIHFQQMLPISWQSYLLKDINITHSMPTGQPSYRCMRRWKGMR